MNGLRISRKLEYALRAMTFLASVRPGEVVPKTEIARRMAVPEDFLNKILKALVRQKLVAATRGVRGGYGLERPASKISFLQVIEAIEGPISLNVCQGEGGGCHHSGACTMFGVWKLGQERMLQVYREVTLDRLAMSELKLAQPA